MSYHFSGADDIAGLGAVTDCAKASALVTKCLKNPAGDLGCALALSPQVFSDYAATCGGCTPGMYTFATKIGTFEKGRTISFKSVVLANCNVKKQGSGLTYPLPPPYDKLDPCKVVEWLPCDSGAYRKELQDRAAFQQALALEALKRQAAAERAARVAAEAARKAALTKTAAAQKEAAAAQAAAEQAAAEAQAAQEEAASAEAEQHKSKTTMYVVAGIAGAAVLGTLAYVMTRKKRAA